MNAGSFGSSGALIQISKKSCSVEIIMSFRVMKKSSLRPGLFRNTDLPLKDE